MTQTTNRSDALTEAQTLEHMALLNIIRLRIEAVRRQIIEVVDLPVKHPIHEREREAFDALDTLNDAVNSLGEGLLMGCEDTAP